MTENSRAILSNDERCAGQLSVIEVVVNDAAKADGLGGGVLVKEVQVQTLDDAVIVEVRHAGVLQGRHDGLGGGEARLIDVVDQHRAGAWVQLLDELAVGDKDVEALLGDGAAAVAVPCNLISQPPGHIGCMVLALVDESSEVAGGLALVADGLIDCLVVAQGNDHLHSQWPINENAGV